MSDEKKDWMEKVCARCTTDGHNIGACEGDTDDDRDTCALLGVFETELVAVESRVRASEAAKYKAVVEAAKAFTSGGQAELCGACAYGRFNARKLSSALAALEEK